MTGKNEPQTICGFCGNDKKTVGQMVEGTGYGEDKKVFICKGCSGSVVDTFEKDEATRRPAKRIRAVPTPRSLKEHLDLHVIGQHAAKRQITVEVANHFRRVTELEPDADDRLPAMLRASGLSDVVIEKSNIVLIGPTGSGKTLLARTLADKMNVPFAIGDATTLTEAGYVGEDVENLLLKLLVAADFDVQAAQRGIIYIDEIDKLRSTGGNVSITRDVSGQGVQQSLLKLIEGTTANVPPQGGRKHPEQQYIQIDTTNILFICGGAFVGLDEIVKKRLNKGGMGFHARPDVETDKEKFNTLMRAVTADDLEQYGLIPELVGRLPVIAPLEEMGRDEMIRILTEPKNALLKQERKKLAYHNIDLVFTDDAVQQIADEAMKKMTGARALRAVVADFMTDIHYNIGKEHRNTKVVVDRDVVLKLKRVVTPKDQAEAA